MHIVAPGGSGASALRRAVFHVRGRPGTMPAVGRVGLEGGLHARCANCPPRWPEPRFANSQLAFPKPNGFTGGLYESRRFLLRVAVRSRNVRGVSNSVRRVWGGSADAARLRI